MVSPGFAIAMLGAVTATAVASACAAIWQARLAWRAGDQKRSEAAQLANTVAADSRIADDVAHDLSDLLTAITGHAELLIANLPPSSARIEDAREIQRAALRATRLAKSLRTVGGGRGAPVEMVDVNAVTSRTVNASRSMLGPRIDVALTLRPDVARVKIRASDLEAILLHLCLHARDEMPDGGRLTVETLMWDGCEGSHAQRAEYVRIAVTDTGGGISAAALARLTHWSYFGDDAERSPIGLGKIQDIVRHAAGEIHVESAAGVGTTIAIDLPAAPGFAADAPASATRASPAAVLVAEDEPGMRELIRVVLVRAGHHVLTVAGSRAALGALRRQPSIALMLVDIVMPEMDGYELVAEARKLSPGLHVVFISAFAPDPHRHPSGDDFLAKPFSGEALTDIVDKALAGSSAERSAI